MNEKYATDGQLDARNEMMKAILDSQLTEQAYGGNASTLYRWGDIAGSSLSFMKDFILTGGLMSGDCGKTSR